MTSYTSDAGQVIELESRHIARNQTDRRIGLAFSGGGIRSASFGMGILQALVADDQLVKADYLSTVSGGGFLGSSLTWFLSRKMKNGDFYGTRPDSFPFGRKREGNKESNRNAVLDFIRQHGNYLIPGSGLNAISLLAVVLRTMLVSLTVYLALTVGAFGVLLDVLPKNRLPMICFGTAMALASIWAIIAGGYSLYTFFRGGAYPIAVRIQKHLGQVTSLTLIFLLLGLLPLIHENMALLLHQFTEPGTDLDDIANTMGISVSAATVLAGSLLALMSHIRQMHSPGAGISSFQILAGAGLLLFGMLYGAYVAATHLQDKYPHLVYPLVACSVLFALLCNVNYFGLNRMYRDRLMEAFMPDPEATDTGHWLLASQANAGKVQDMCAQPNQRPYHLINCNIVLIDSNNAKYRGRKGDSFTISPLFTGSDATGWRRTDAYMHNRFRNGLTLPTAMAISGAAANPNAGVSGTGVTTNQFVSVLMSILNLRLGFWASNPRIEKSWLPPNYLYPGIKGGIPLGSGLNEKDSAIELTDGGHFENLAIYELLRRRLDLIIVSDAGADEAYTFSDLANAVERARVDFGTNIVFYDDYPLEDVMPDSDTGQGKIEQENYHLARRCFAIARIEYTKETRKEDRKIGHLVYIKPTLTQGLSADILSYKKLHDSYPHQSTLDQFFTEQQFEAYRELGYYLGWQVLTDGKVKALLG